MLDLHHINIRAVMEQQPLSTSLISAYITGGSTQLVSILQELNSLS